MNRGQRIAVTIALHPDEYDYMVKGGRCDDCGHLKVLHGHEGFCRVCDCPFGVNK